MPPLEPHTPAARQAAGAACAVGAVSFLNARPLIAGLDRQPAVRLSLEVPSRLAVDLAARQLDVALLPAIDLLRLPGPWRILPAGCIAAEGETLTVRIFSRVAPAAITALWADTDSHCSIALARVLWRRLYDRPLMICPYNARKGPPPAEADAVLLIGDKVVTDPPLGYDRQFDLGRLWTDLTDLPFVFALWAGRAQLGDAALRPIDAILAAARKQGQADAPAIARREGPALGWPSDLAETYLTRHMKYELTDRALMGLDRFFQLACQLQLAPKVDRPSVL